MEPSIIDRKQATIASIKTYFAAHPGSPSTVWRPLLFRHGNVWKAFLVPNLRKGIAGVGPTVEAALSDFDTQYLRVLRPPEVSSKNQTALAKGARRVQKKFAKLTEQRCARADNIIEILKRQGAD
jgi:hypothetical protein